MDIVYAWIAAVASGIIPLIIKASSKTLVRNPWQFNILWMLFSIPFISGFGFLMGGGLPESWYSLVLLAFCHAGFYTMYTFAQFRIDVSVMGPLFSLRMVFATLLGIYVLHEQITIFGVFLISVIVLVTPLAAYSEKLQLRAFFSKDIFIAVIAMAFLALVGFFANLSVRENGFGTTLLWENVITLAILLPTLRFVPARERKVKLKKLKPFLAIGFMQFIFTSTAVLAFSNNLSLSSIIVSLPLSMVFAFILSKKYGQYFEVNTNRVYVVRFLGAVIMVGSAIWLSFL